MANKPDKGGLYLVEAPYKVNDGLFDVDLSVDRALSLMNESDKRNYGAMYDWFMAESGSIGSRLFGKRLPGVDQDFAHAAQRGIHVPSQRKYAASVTVKLGSIYEGQDGQMIPMGNGTWFIFYSAHRNNTGGETASTWNRGLMNCLDDGVPVGVFIEQNDTSKGYYRALAFVEEYDPARDMFTLHGPVTSETMPCFASPTPAEGMRITPALTTEEMSVDARAFATTRKAIRKGQQAFRSNLIRAYEGKCAVCGCSVGPVLQAAHIIDYRGSQSNSVNNGILLRADLHVLFDNALIGVNPDTFSVELNSSLAGTDYESMCDQKIYLPKDPCMRPSEDYLGVKYARFKATCA